MLLRSLRVVHGTEPIDCDDRFFADNPGVMPLRKTGDVARPCDELGSVVHPDGQLSGDVVLEMRRFAALRSGDRFDLIRPAPPRFEGQPANGAITHVQDLGLAREERRGVSLGLPKFSCSTVSMFFISSRTVVCTTVFTYQEGSVKETR